MMWSWEAAKAKYTYNTTAVISFAISLCLYKLADIVYTHIFGSAYTTLNLKKRSDWKTRFPSIIHAVIVSALSTYALIFETQLRDDTVWGDSFFAKTSCAIVTGYMLSDLSIMLWHYDLLGDISFVFHHLATISAYLISFNYHLLEYCAMLRLIAEYSTPFLNLRVFLDDIGMRMSKTYVINGLLFMTLFLALRICTMPYFYYVLYSMHGTPAFVAATNAGTGFKFILYASCLTLDLLNAHWATKVVSGFHKALRQHRAASGGSATKKAPPLYQTFKNGGSQNGVAKKAD